MLNVVSADEAKKIIKEKLDCTAKSERVCLENSVGRVIFSDIESGESIPSFDRSTVDGYAVIAGDTYGSSQSIPSILKIKKEILMGESADFSIESGECAKISTGGMLPENANAVVMVENTEPDGELCLVQKAVSPFENVTKKGDDIKENEVIIKSGTLITPVTVGVLAGMGIKHPEVYRKPIVAIISTGDEIVDTEETPMLGQVRDINTYLISALCEKYGCEVKKYGVLKDEYEKLYSSLETACGECDAVLISGGSSAGTRDMTGKIISSLGKVYIHGLAMKPGKPTIIGKVDSKAVIGLPGHPAAAYFVTEIIVKDMLCSLSGMRCENIGREYLLKTNVSSNHGREEYVCVSIDGEYAVPMPAKSGVISTLSKADGYIKIERNLEGLRANERVTVYSF